MSMQSRQSSTAAPPRRSLTEFATVTADDLVTGEGVALDVPPASVAVRLVSGIIDLLATMVIAFVAVFVLVVAASRADPALLQAALVLAIMVVFVVWPTTFETLTRGRSLGKLAMGLRTVRDDGGPISFQHALVRSLVGFVEIYVFQGAIAFLCMIVNRRGKRFGDLAAGTYVVRSRVKLQLPVPAAMPPGLRSWAAHADIAALPTGLAIAVRQFLSRQTAVDPAVHDRIGRALLADVLTHVAPPPPTDAPADAVLAAVVAERRERDLARLRRDAEVRDRLAAAR